MNQKKCNTCGLFKYLENDFYWDSFNQKYESQCKRCRLIKQKTKQRQTYNPQKERERYLKRKERGEFDGRWKKWKEKYPEKYKARYTLRNAVKLGKIKKGICEIDNDCNGRIEGHHNDYSKPLIVRWLCQKHHKLHHYPLNSLSNTKK